MTQDAQSRQQLPNGFAIGRHDAKNVTLTAGHKDEEGDSALYEEEYGTYYFLSAGDPSNTNSFATVLWDNRSAPTLLV